ncbi:hypothetical protein ABTY14_30505 [Streptomyces hydrogenans]
MLTPGEDRPRAPCTPRRPACSVCPLRSASRTPRRR